VHSSSHLSCLLTRTSHTQYHTGLDTTSSATSWSGWWTGVWDLWDPQLQGWPSMQNMQVARLGTLVQLQRDWQRNILASCHWTRQHYRTLRRLSCPVPRQTWTTCVHVVLLPPPFLRYPFHSLSLLSVSFYLLISLTVCSSPIFFINKTKQY